MLDDAFFEKVTELDWKEEAIKAMTIAINAS